MSQSQAQKGGDENPCQQFAMESNWIVGLKSTPMVLSSSEIDGGDMGMKNIPWVVSIFVLAVFAWLTCDVYAWADEGIQKWAFMTKSEVASSPAVGPDGTVYVGSDDNHLYAVSADGTQKWAFKTGGSVISSPVIGPDGTIYVGSGDGTIYAVNQDGSLKWTFQTGDVVYSSPLVGPDGTIYVASWDRYVYAIDPNGTQKWAFETGNGVFSSPAMGPDGAIYIGSSDGKLYAIKGGKKSEPEEINGREREAATEAMTVDSLAREETRGRVTTKAYALPAEGPSEIGSPTESLAVKENDIPVVVQEGFKEIKDIRFEVEGDGEERVVFLLNTIYAPKILTVAQAWPRVVCDFAGARLARGLEGEIRVHSTLIQRIRASSYGPSGFGVKVVLDMHPDKEDLLEGQFFDEEYVYASGEQYLYMLIFKPNGVGTKSKIDNSNESLEKQE